VAKFCPEKEGLKSIEPLIKWYIVNYNKEEASLSHGSAPGQFSYIQTKAWDIIVRSLEGGEGQAAKVYESVMHYISDSVSLNRSNIYLAVMLRAKTFSFVLNLLKELKAHPELHNTLRSFLEKQGFFKQILSTLEHLKTLETEDNKLVKEQELANQLNLLSEQAPKDWLAYRQGAKNHVFELRYESKGYHSLLFEKEQAFWPSVVAVGFETNSGTAGTVLAPREVLVEIGDEKDKLSLVGTMSLVPF
jgi:uncharacterized protein YcgL (UPF0745 family)